MLQQHVFYRGDNGDIQHIWWSGGDNTTRTDNWTTKGDAPRSAPSNVACNTTDAFPSS